MQQQHLAELESAVASKDRSIDALRREVGELTAGLHAEKNRASELQVNPNLTQSNPNLTQSNSPSAGGRLEGDVCTAGEGDCSRTGAA